MARTSTPSGAQRIAVPVTAEERAALDRLAAEDRRTRPEQIKWLIEQEVARRDASRAATGTFAATA